MTNKSKGAEKFKEFFCVMQNPHITGKYDADLEINHKIDNRGAYPIDITDENARYYKDKQGNESIHCPHCGCALDRFVCMPHHYCYVCGGRFGNINLKSDKEVEDEQDI